MEKQTHREPILYIVGNQERKDEIRHLLEDEWGGLNEHDFYYDNELNVYYINQYGVIVYSLRIDFALCNAVENGWMKEYKLPEKPQIKPFDKVLVKAGYSKWAPAFFGHIEGDECWLLGYGWVNVDKSIILPFNEQTAKLIGTNDEWKGGNNE